MNFVFLLQLCVVVTRIALSNGYTEVLATSNTCFNAADGNAALNYKFNAPYDGIISGVRLVHNSGGTTCRSDRALTNWGCITSGGDRFWTNLLQVSSDETSVTNAVKLYPTTDTNNIVAVGTATCGPTVHTYQLTNYGINSNEMILQSDTTHFEVSTDDSFILGATEAVCFTSTHDNSGTSCAEVYFLYDEIFTCNNELDIKCRASGDPHFTTWDTSRHHFQGVGYYDYITACSGEFFPFTITARQEECGRWAPMTCITEVRVTLSDGRVIIFPRNGNANPTWMSSGSFAVGNDQTFADGTFSVSPGSFSGTFRSSDSGDTDITIMFTYSGAYFQAMTSSDCMTDRICGVCGNVNSDPTDDFEKRDGNIVDNTNSGTWRVPDDVWENTFCFGDSWCNEQFTNDPDCTPTPPPSQPPTECLDAARLHCADVFEEYCEDECSTGELDYGAWLEDCIFDSCVASNNNLGDYGLGDALNNGFFDSSLDECRHFCDIPEHHPFLADCGPCNDQCTELTTELGCANNECLDTCKECISDIPWYDYNGGQSNQCQCHNNGCDQCQDGWFKIDYDFPCQSCSGLIGCLHCTDFWGCQQCDSGYTMVESNTCGENSLLNTGNTKFHYCVPDDNVNGRCKIGDPGFDDNKESTTPPPRVPSCPVTPCGSNPCDCTENDKCNDCQSWGCNECADGHYQQSFGHPCVSCYDAFDGNCMTCTDWQGCTLCKDGYTSTWDSDCGTHICVPN